MPADDKKVVKLESRPTKPISMPEYHYQDYVVTEHFSSGVNSERPEKEPDLDLRGVTLNLM